MEFVSGSGSFGFGFAVRVRGSGSGSGSGWGLGDNPFKLAVGRIPSLANTYKSDFKI